ncbi:hypothetical protein [Nonomuraea cavernae]|uniref:Uncharacterized protein n=1 Tax=Nonomuraea cavernae TaxID=2045107 RepID=A0A917YW90_9ACTN|nr:hypothetical protein [Nonomuraea cavernae]MCA2186916.1 hypothetical protein [Nonomuraea cavernae]GGO67195.1 hypothetical protein GCM10012289_23040 [Nonomuraea cavernae]
MFEAGVIEEAGVEGVARGPIRARPPVLPMEACPALGLAAINGLLRQEANRHLEMLRHRRAARRH